MAENLMNSSHIASTDAYREGWERIWNKQRNADEKQNQMEIVVRSYNDAAVRNLDGDELSIIIDGVEKFQVSDGEPEDNTLNRNFNDCWKIPDLLAYAWSAGRSGKELVIREEQYNPYEDL